MAIELNVPQGISNGDIAKQLMIKYHNNEAKLKENQLELIRSFIVPPKPKAPPTTGGRKTRRKKYKKRKRTRRRK